MSLARILFVLGIALIIYAVISGIYVSYKMTNGEGDLTTGYSFKAGLFLLGILLAYLGRKSKKAS